MKKHLTHFVTRNNRASCATLMVLRTYALMLLRSYGLTVLLLFCFSAFLQLKAQTPIYQLLNGDFEAPFYQETSSSSSVVPHGYNSFYSAAGSLATLGAAQRCASSTDVRPGSAGTQSLRIYSNSVLGIRANGNVTSGRIYAGNMTANSADNYNYTEYTAMTTYTPANPPKFMQQITGTPDSLRFWAKYAPGSNNSTDKSRIRVYIHGTGPCRDAPQYPAGMTEVELYYGKAMEEITKADGNWNSYQVPFNYNGTNTIRNDNGNYYILISMTTNATPGGGSGGADQVWFDDIEFVYSAWLTDIKVNGVTIDGFHKNLLTYGGPTLQGCPLGTCPFPYQPGDFSWTKEAHGNVVVVINNIPGPLGDADGGYTSILVTAEDGVTTKEYKIWYFTNRSDDNNILAASYTLDGATSVAVNPFYPTQVNYNISINNPEETNIPQIVESSILLSDPATAEIQRIEQPTGVNSKGMVVVRAENLKLKTYNFMFSKVISTNTKLGWIKVNGSGFSNADIPNFDADLLEYELDVTGCATAMPTVSCEKSSPWANVNITQATNSNRTATITVTAESGAQRTYTINFVLKNNDASLSGCRIGSTNYNFPAGSNLYVHTASFTAAQTLTIQDAQKGCGAATIERDNPATLYYPDTNYFRVTAQDGITTQTYKVVIKNSNYSLTTGANNAFRYNYNGLVNQNTGINITSTNNGNTNPVTTTVVTTPAGPNVPAQLVLLESGIAAAVARPTVHIEQPTCRTCTATVTITANDGVTQKVYNVPFNFTASNDPSLSNITWNGKNIDGFSSSNTYYLVGLDASVTEVPEIIGTPTFQWLPPENIIVTPADDLFGTTTIFVKAENGTATRTYNVEFTVQGDDNAFLSVLGYKIGDVSYVVPNFRPTVFEYEVDIPFTAPTPVLYGTPMSPGASLFPASQGDFGKLLVISKNMLGMKIYTVNFNRVKNTNATLTDIKINDVSLDGFDSEEFEYAHELSYTELTAPVVTATPAYPFSTVHISEIDTVIGIVTITVTAEDNAFTEVYTIDFTRELSPVTDIHTFSYDYNNQSFEVTCTGTEMTIALPAETEGDPLITGIVLADNRATFEIEEQPDETNNLTGTIMVTAEDETEETYSVVFERTFSGSTLLTGISYFLGSTEYQIEEFDPEILTYYRILPYNNSTTPTVAATKGWKNTVTTYTQPTNPFGQGSILVTSENGQNNKTYTIVFQRKGDAHLADLYYTLNGEDFPIPNFNPAIYTYNISLPLCTTAVPELVYLPEDSRCDITYIAQNTPNGTSSVKLVTWNLDDSLTYKVNFTVLLSTEALLSDLQINGATIPNFNANTFDYIVPIYLYGTPVPVVTATAKYCDASVNITNSGSFPGTIIYTIEVTAGNLSTNTYTVSCSMEAGDNNYLLDLLIDGVHWWEFKKDKYFYKIIKEHGTTVFPEVTGIPEDERADVAYEILEGGKIVNIIVTAINGDVAVYQVVFGIAGNNNAFAKMIYVDWEPLPNFNKFVREYEYHLPTNYSGIPTVTVELDDPNAHLDPPNISIPYVTKIHIVAEDEDTEMEYTITFIKGNTVLNYSETEIQVYPNPSSNYIHFKIDEQIETGYLEIFSMEGKKVGEHTLQNGVNTVNIEPLQNGIYFYKIFANQTMISAGKFIKN